MRVELQLTRISPTDLARMRATLNPVVALLGLSICCLLEGCQTLGPVALGVGRGAYNEVIARTSSEQTLSLIVRLRYSDPIGLLMVTSVTAGLKFSAQATGQAGFGPRANYAGNLIPFSAGMGYEDSPTISALRGDPGNTDHAALNHPSQVTKEQATVIVKRDQRRMSSIKFALFEKVPAGWIVETQGVYL